MYHLSALGGVADGLLGYVGARLAQAQGLAGVQHAAVGIAAAVDEVVLGLLGSGAEHRRTLEPVGNHRLADFRTEVAEVDAQGVAAGLLHVLQGLLGVYLALDDADGTLVDVGSAELLYILGDDGLAAVHGQ